MSRQPKIPQPIAEGSLSALSIRVCQVIGGQQTTGWFDLAQSETAR